MYGSLHWSQEYGFSAHDVSSESRGRLPGLSSAGANGLSRLGGMSRAKHKVHDQDELCFVATVADEEVRLKIREESDAKTR